MTPHEMETLLRNIDLRTSRIEQILPTLATKQDLKTEIAAVRSDLKSEIGTVRSELRTLIEATRSDIQLLAEHLSGVMQRIPRDR